MPFIGKAPETGAFRLIDSITTSATDTYALTVQGDYYFPASARNLIVSLNGVTQAPESAYTVSGSHIVFASALTANDVIDYILVIGDAVDIGTPSDGTVGNAQLKASLDFSGKTLTFSNDQISGDAVDGGTISNFASTGIDDNATSTALTVTDSGIAATLTTAAQPNITSVGTLSALSVTGDLTVDTDTLVVDSTNNRVGINDAAPDRAFVATSSQQVVGRIESTSTAGLLGFSDSGSANAINVRLGSVGDNFKIYTGGAEQVTIDSSGRVGIGESSPSTKLEVADVSPATITLKSTNSIVTAEAEVQAIDFYQSDASGGAGVSARIVGVGNNASGAQNLTFHTGQAGSSSVAERMRIDSNGNVGIGVTDPDEALEVAGTIKQSGTNPYPIKIDSNTLVYYPHYNSAHIAYYKRAVHPANSNEYHYYWRTSDTGTAGGANETTWMTLHTGATHGGKLYLASGVSFDSGFASAHTLDDYEEGNSWSFNTVSPSGLVATNYHTTYTKVGRLCHVSIFIQIASNTNTNALYLTLPFNSVSSSYSSLAMSYKSGGTGSMRGPLVHSNSNLITIRDTGGALMSYSQFSSASFIISGTYETA